MEQILMCSGRTRAENKSPENWRNHNTHKIELRDNNKNYGDCQNHHTRQQAKRKVRLPDLVLLERGRDTDIYLIIFVVVVAIVLE